MLPAATLLAMASTTPLSEEYLGSNMDAMWSSFKRSYGKGYTGAEEALRRSTFEMNMRKAVEQQRRNPHATFGFNAFSDLTPQEWTESRAGLRAPTERELAAIAKKPKLHSREYVAAKIPSIVDRDMDWRVAGVVTSVRDQGRCGGCWAFATVGAIEGAWARGLHKLEELSEQFLISCARGNGPFPYEHGRDPSWKAGDCGGGVIPYAFEYLEDATDGKIVTEADYPYVEHDCSATLGCQTATCAYQSTMKWGAQITGHVAVDTNEEAMLSALESHGPVAVGVYSDPLQSYTGGVITDCPAGQIDHGVLVVGYGHEDGSGMKYWIIKNSWGKGYGESGYVRVQYGRNLCNIVTMPHVALVETPHAAPGVVPVPMEFPLAPVVVPAVEPEPFYPPAAAGSGSGSSEGNVCVSGDDCECKNSHFHWIGLDGRKVGPAVCASMLVVAGAAALFFLLLGVCCGRCCCAVQQTEYRRVPRKEPESVARSSPRASGPPSPRTPQPPPARPSPPRSAKPSPTPSPRSQADLNPEPNVVDRQGLDDILALREKLVQEQARRPMPPPAPVPYYDAAPPAPYYEAAPAQGAYPAVHGYTDPRSSPPPGPPGPPRVVHDVVLVE